MEEKPYVEQLAAIHADGYASSDSWKRYLEPEGDFSVVEHIVNVEPLQKRWALEHRFSYNENNWCEEILRAQIAESRPDILYAHAWQVARRYLPAILRENKGLFTMAFDGVAKHDDGVILNVDLLLSCLPRTVDFYERLGRKAYYLPHAFDPVLIDRCARRAVDPVDVSFVGQVSAVGGHRDRARWLGEICRAVKVDCWLGEIPSFWAILRRQAGEMRKEGVRGLAGFPQAMRHISRLRQQNRGSLFGLEMYNQLQSSKISLNHHIAAAGSMAANMRLFEATGMGSCLLTDWKENLGELFEPDQEVVAFRSTAEAIEKIRWLLENEPARAGIAKAGQARVLASHNLADKLRDFGAYIRKKI